MADKVYRAVNGSSYGGSKMLKENDSAPGSCPEERKNVEFPEVMCGGVMAEDSVEYSDMLSNKRAAGVKKQLAKTPY